jgi:hypothetical protein
VPSDPGQRNEEEPAYYMGLLVGLVHSAVESGELETTEPTWRDIHEYLMRRCKEPVAGPVVFLLVNYFRRTDIR